MVGIVKDFQLTNLSSAELDARAAAAVTHYGVGTKSYLKSTEKREMDRQQKVVTERIMSAPRPEVIIQRCNCRSFNLPHDISRHRELKSEFDWRTEDERKAIQYEGWWE